MTALADGAAPAPIRRSSRMRRAVIRTVTASAAIPQYSLSLDVDFGAVKLVRDALRAEAPDASVADVINLACIRALESHPLANAYFLDDAVVCNESINLSLIVEVDDGMLTPTVMGAEQRAVGDLVSERRRLTAAALRGELRPEETVNGTFTVSNLGTFGIHRFNAMVIPPQAAVLAVGAPVSAGALTVTLTCDHRVLDGAPAARFLADVGRHLQQGRP